MSGVDLPECVYDEDDGLVERDCTRSFARTDDAADGPACPL